VRAGVARASVVTIAATVVELRMLLLVWGVSGRIMPAPVLAVGNPPGLTGFARILL
jgi:hypothetical protein